MRIFLKRIQEGAAFKKAAQTPDALLRPAALLLKKALKRKAALYALAAGFLAADWAALRSESFFFPSVKGRTAAKRQTGLKEAPLKMQYKMIWEDNIFHIGPIPERLFSEKIQPSDPIKTSLPFTLKGTIVHSDPHRSIATVKGRKGSRAYSVGNVIEEQAEITQIEKRRIVFLNKQSGLSEFLETIEKSALSVVGRRMPSIIQKPRVKKPALVRQLRGGSRQVRRSDLQKYLQPEKLHEVLRQARMVPNRKINEDGEMSVEGFRFASIQSGSVYEDLGFKVGDIVSEVEGEQVNSIDKAGELFHRFKTSGRLQLKVNGEVRTYTVEEDAPIN